MRWKCRKHCFDLSRRALVMGIINVTPDSFSDGGRYLQNERAVACGLRLVEEGADLLDIGGESTRPGAEPVTLAEELRRVIPVVEALREVTAVPISLDTTKAEVARQALEAGADIINDVTALQGDPAMAAVAVRYGAGLVLMHMRGTPRTMQAETRYADLMGEIIADLREAMAQAQAAGADPDCITLDPGLGFAKNFAQNLEIFHRLGELVAVGRPVLMGPSRKNFLGQILGLPPAERVEGTAAAVTAAILSGARIVRVHDVREMARVVRVAEALSDWATPRLAEP
jgi:dihydropteroate synthase